MLLQLVMIDIQNEFTHDLLWVGEDLPDEFPAGLAQRADIFEDVFPSVLLQLDLLDEGVDALVVAFEVGQDEGNVLHPGVVPRAVRFDELFDEGALDLGVLLLDASDGVGEFALRKLLRDELQLLDDVCSFMKARPEKL